MKNIQLYLQKSPLQMIFFVTDQGYILSLFFIEVEGNIKEHEESERE